MIDRMPQEIWMPKEKSVIQRSPNISVGDMMQCVVKPVANGCLLREPACVQQPPGVYFHAGMPLQPPSTKGSVRSCVCVLAADGYR